LIQRHDTKICRRLAGASVLALALSALVLPQVSWGQDKPPPPPSLDDQELDIKVDTSAPIEAEKWLRLWADKLKLPIFIDQQMTGTKIKFLQSDVKLTWGLAKKILDFYDVVLDEKDVNGHMIVFAHLRRNIPAKLGPPFPVVDENTLPPREEIVTAVIQVTNGAGNDIFATVRGLLVRDVNRIGNILYVRGPEVIIIVDYSANVEYYLKIIRALDVQAPGQITRVIQINFAPAEDIVRVIQTLLRPGGAGAPGVPVGAGAVPGGFPGAAALLQPQVIADQRTNKLIVQAYKHQFDEINRMIGELDVKAPNRPPTFHVYKCKNVDAPYLAAKLQQLFTGQASGAPGKRQTKAPGAGGQPGQQGVGAGGPINLSPQSGTPGQPGQKTDVFGVETRIVPDERSNSLLIQAEDNIYRQILDLLNGKGDVVGLDLPLRRVLIEAQVWEIATPTDSMTIGFELADVDNARQGSFRGAAGTSFGLSSLTIDPTGQRLSRIPNISNGITAVLTKDTFDKLPVIMQAVANLEHSRLVTTPFTLTNDNTEALFEIDNRIPYVTSNLAGTGLSQQNVQYTDVKTSLTVTPQVNSDENLTLSVEVQLSSIGAAGSATLPPSTNDRHYKGEVTVPNMKYVVFGGLESESWGSVESKVPFLGDIPILGHLFKQKTWTHTKSKIYIFMRPTIFLDDARGSGDQKLTSWSNDAHERIHVEAERDEWLPPICADRFLKSPFRTVQDEVFDVFGTGSGNPFTTSPRDE
jgi:general secretion pathway protein D